MVCPDRALVMRSNLQQAGGFDGDGSVHTLADLRNDATRIANVLEARRDDDIILSAGHRIAPFAIESCLIEHPAAAESGVAGKTPSGKIRHYLLREGTK